jgi:hypothetical protein
VAGPGNILITVGADTAAAIRGLSNVNSSLGDTMTTSEKMSAGLKKAAVPAAAALGAIGIAAVGAAKAAMEDAAGTEHLADTLRRVTGAGDAAIAGMEDWISKTSLATGVADDKLRPALEKLATATGDVKKSQELMNVALDISAATGKDVDVVSTALAKGYQGQTAAMAKLVPGLDEGARKSKDFDTILGELAKTTGGAASESANTAAGQMKRFNVATSELYESLGYSLLPIVQALVPWLMKVAAFAQENTTAIKILVGVVALLAGGILAANVALKAYEAAQIIVKAATVAWTAVQWLLNAALTANPIGLVIAALALLAAGLVAAYLKSETFRDVVKAALGVVKVAVDALGKAFAAAMDAARVAFDWIVAHWKVALFALGPVGAAIALVASNFDAIKAAASTAWDFVVGAWNVGKFAFAGVASGVQAIASAFDAIAGAVNGAIAAVQNLISWLGRIHVPSINLPHVPNPFGLPPPAVPGPNPRARAGAPAAAAAGGLTVNVYGAVDVEGTARAIRRVLVNHDRRQGRLV